MVTTLMDLFKQAFDRGATMKWARELGAVQRARCIHPLDFCLAVVGCAIGDEERSIATARRLFQRLTGFMPEESSFYERFTGGMLALMQRMFQQQLDASSSVQRAAIAAALGGTGVIDMLAVDSTQGLLPASAAAVLPSTDDGHGGFKLTAILSVLFQRVHQVAFTDARTHDRLALRLQRWLHGMLFLFDRGYSDHGLFATIEDRGGFFLTRFKKSSTPIITAILSGLGQAQLGRPLTEDLPFRGVVDLRARFRLRRGGSRVFRVVRITVDGPNRQGRRERVDIWLVTNLAAETFDAEAIATLYRMRWEVEILFHTLKSVGRLDQLRSANIEVIRAFVYATLIGMLLAHEICAQMRREKPEREPSPHRVAMLVLGALPGMVASLGTRRYREEVAAFVTALWREGVNPNPGRPYAAHRYARELRRAA